MLLCLDCGNTRLKWGMIDDASPGHHWLAQGAMPLAEISRLPHAIAALPHPRQMIACNVASNEAHTALEKNAKIIGAPLFWSESRAAQCGVTNGYEQPAQLGADRWAALIGARQMHSGPGLVVNCGTATTVDMIDANGIFRGGIILPGVDLMRASLAQRTARLPLADGEFRALPRNTRDAIDSGCRLATAGAIERMFALIGQEPDAVCLLSGGAAGSVATLLDIPLRRIDNLVLEGLARIGRSATSSLT
jgi:type III pantothenate kinase